MKLPLSWLRDYVAFEGTAGELAERLTFSGTEIEGIAVVGEGLEGVVVAEVLGFTAHPNAAGPRVCRVHDGRRELEVVCGAANFTVGDRVPLAPAGTTLPGGRRVEAAAIRGVPSAGMLCAEDELGLSDDHAGLLLLPRETARGAALAGVLGLPDTVLTVEITWNRPDCLSIIGMAREVAALYRLPLRRPGVEFLERGEPVDALAEVAIEDPAGCPRYTGRVLTDGRIGPSPLWMQRRLALCGVRAINNMVDITNYVMLECGQPLHAFDYGRVRDHRIVVRRARAGERLDTLDGQTRELTPDMLVIADPVRAVALAGVMGGAGSEIGAATRHVLLESACFDAPMIHRTSVAAGLSTESSYRFERGVDIGGVDWASRRAAALLVEHAGMTAARGAIDAYPGAAAPRRVSCRFGRMRALLGVDVPDGTAVDILTALQLPVVARDASACTVEVPTFRRDLAIEADLIEEVARVHGLARVPDATPAGQVVSDADDTPTRALLRCRHNLVGLGLYETMNYSFLADRQLDLFGTEHRARRVVLPDPVSADHAVLRDSLLPQMAESLGRNLARQVSQAAFFEIGRVFLKDASGRIGEDARVSLGLMGRQGENAVDGKRPPRADELFLRLKGLIEALLAAQHAGVMTGTPVNDSRFEEGYALAVEADGRRLGIMGLLARRIRAEWRMNDPVALAELALAPLLERAFEQRPLKPLPAYPSVARDVALVADESVTHACIEAAMRRHAPPELTEIRLFDIFRGEEMGKGRRSLAYSLTYRSPERTLTDEDANRYHEAVKAGLKSDLNVEIRDR